jgi:hypothetical protein
VGFCCVTCVTCVTVMRDGEIEGCDSGVGSVGDGRRGWMRCGFVSWFQ